MNKCRLCANNTKEVIDLGASPPANNFINSEDDEYQAFPLIVDFCESCYCIQLRDCLNHHELYKSYTYATPQSSSLTNQYENILSIIKEKFKSTKELFCFEIGSNNGDLLYFLENEFQKVLGLDPAENIVKLATKKGVNTICEFFDAFQAERILNNHGKPNVIIARHMFAHNEDPQKLMDGITKLLDEDGLVLIENAYAVDTLIKNEFDQIYHEHMFYYSAITIQKLFKKNNLELFNIDFSDVHGGSALFVAGKKGKNQINESLIKTVENEKRLFEDMDIFNSFVLNIENSKKSALKYIQSELQKRKKIICYGAPAKAFTVFSYYGLSNEEISLCIDTTPEKQGKLFPKFNIPIYGEEKLDDIDYDIVIVNAWNYKEEIIKKSSKIFNPGTKLVFLVPSFYEFTVK